MIARKAKRPRRVRLQPVRLTADERERMERLVALYGGTYSDVLRAGIGALEREHAEQARDEAAWDAVFHGRKS